MLAQKSISLAMASTVLVLVAGVANANNIEVKNGDLQVSIQDRTVSVQSSPSRRRPPSLLERLQFWRSNASSVPQVSASGKCRSVNSSHQSTRTSSSGSGVVRTSSSSSSTV